jgi:predicted dehydrogenase
MKKLKVGIFGYGYMGEIRRNVVEKDERLSLEFVCETDPTKLKGDSYPFKIYRNIDEALAVGVDAVYVCTPNHLIPQLAIECMKRGRHVFCEKPPGRTLQDIADIRAQEEKSPGIKLMFGFNHRHHPGIQRAKRLIEGGHLGKVLWLRGVYGKSGGKSFPSSWRNDKSVSGGGILLDQGIHMIDIFNYFCEDFEKVKAFTGNTYWNFPVEDNAFVVMENAKKQHAILHSSATLWKHKFQIEVGMEKGYIIVEGLLSKSGSYGRETLKVGRQQFEDQAEAVGNPSEEITYFDKDLSWEIEMSRFAECVLSDKAVSECGSWDAYKAMRIVDRAYKNSEET